jgi:hypothetical protein
MPRDGRREPETRWGYSPKVNPASATARIEKNIPTAATVRTEVKEVSFATVGRAADVVGVAVESRTASLAMSLLRMIDARR